MLVEARGAQLEAPRRAPDHHAVDDQGGNRQNKTDVQRRIAQGWEPGGEARHFAAFRKHAAGRVLLARRNQVLHDDEVHQAGGDEVEHDGGDHNVAATLGLQIAGQEAPQRAEQGRAEHGGRNQEPGGQRLVEGQHGHRQAQAADIHLAFGTDIEQAGLHRHGDRQARENEGAGVEQGVAQAFRIEDGAVDEDTQRFGRVFAQHINDQGGDQQGRQQV